MKPGASGDSTGLGTTPHASQTQFESIEEALEYLTLLTEVVGDAQTEIRDAMRDTLTPRNLQALQLVAYKLSQLSQHMLVSRRLLNDLRTLRRLLHGERDNASSR
jgi:hypothetical protein